MPVPAPAGVILSFASPKESIQRKGDPDAAYFLRSSLLNGVAGRGSLPLRQRDASLHRPCGLFRSKAPVLGAAYGRKTIPEFTVESDKFDFQCSVFEDLPDKQRTGELAEMFFG
jgi:hypothetical protein